MNRVGNLVKEELRERIVKGRRSDRVMAMALMFEEEIVRVIYAYGQQGGKAMVESSDFMMNWHMNEI